VATTRLFALPSPSGGVHPP